MVFMLCFDFTARVMQSAVDFVWKRCTLYGFLNSILFLCVKCISSIGSITCFVTTKPSGKLCKIRYSSKFGLSFKCFALSVFVFIEINCLFSANNKIKRKGVLIRTPKLKSKGSDFSFTLMKYFAQFASYLLCPFLNHLKVLSFKFSTQHIKIYMK